MSYEKAKKIKEFRAHLKWFFETVLIDINDLTTGNLSHHKNSIRSKIKDLQTGYKKISPLLIKHEMEIIKAKGNGNGSNNSDKEINRALGSDD